MIADRLRELGLILPDAHTPQEPLEAVLVHDGVARVSGQLPRQFGVVTEGVLGQSVTTSQGIAAARACALNVLAALDRTVGLDSVERVLHVTGYVACVPGFGDIVDVIDGASKVLGDVFGEAGRHTRTAIGVVALPRGAAVEVEASVAVR